MSYFGCNKDNKKKEKMEYLIILEKSDTIGGNLIFPNKKNLILKNKKLFFGNINIIIYEDYLEDKYPEYVIENPIIEHIFILLHKENKYVSYENYNTLFMNSKMDELENIFIYLKASNIIIKEYYSNTERIEFSTGGEINIPKLEIGNSIEINNEVVTNVKRLKEKEFNPNNKIVFNTEYFKDTKIFYHLQYNEEWIDIITNRLTKGLTKDKFNYRYYHKVLFNVGIVNKLNFLNIETNYLKKYIDITNIEYEVIYPSLKVKNVGIVGEIEEDDCSCKCIDINIEKKIDKYLTSCINNDHYMEYN